MDVTKGALKRQSDLMAGQDKNNVSVTGGSISGITLSASSASLASILFSDVGTIAAAGSAQGDAEAIVNQVSYVTAADGTKGVVLPSAEAGALYVVYSTVATSGLLIYPASGDDINDGTSNAAVTIEGKTMAIFVGMDDTTWGAIYTADS